MYRKKNHEATNTKNLLKVTALGDFIREHRLILKLTQTDLANKVGFSTQEISLFERGFRKYLTEEQQRSFAEALRVEISLIKNVVPVKGKQPDSDLGKLIRQKRIELGLNPDSFARKLGVSVHRVKRLELYSEVITDNIAKLLIKVLRISSAEVSKFLVKDKKNLPNSNLAKLIYNRRKQLLISASTLARKIGISRQAINQIESGQYFLSKNTGRLIEIAEVLKIDVERLKKASLKDMGKENRRIKLTQHFVDA